MFLLFFILSVSANAAHRDIPNCMNAINYSDSIKLARGDFLITPKKGAFVCDESECCCWDGFDPETSDVQLNNYGHCEITVNLQKRENKNVKKQAAISAEAVRQSRISEIKEKLKIQDLSLQEQNELLRLERGL